MKLCRVYDDRTNKTIFQSENEDECIDFMIENYSDDSPDFEHIWLETFEM